MPTVRKNESRSKYISRCIPVVMRESGTKSRAHAVAKCHGMWKQVQKQEQISNKELSNDATGVENLSGGASETTPRDTRSNAPTVKSISRNGARRRVEAGDSNRMGTIYPSRSRGKTLNQRKRRRVVHFNPLRVDPTRTTTLRRIFQQALSARFRLLKGKLLRLIVDEDAFGLRKYNQVQSLNQEERSDEQQSNTGNSESNAASREGSEAASKPSGSSGNEVGRLGGGEGKATASREDYVFINQNKEQGDDTGRQSERVDKGRVIDGQQGRGDGEASGKTGREIQLGVENTRGVEGADNRDLVTNQRWAFHTNPEKVKQFQVWLQTQIQADILTVTAEQAENAYWTKYVKEGYRKGAGRAFDDVNVAKRAESYGGSERLTGFYEGTREQFLQSSFGRPVAVEKVKLLTGRVFTELKGVTEAMATTITRELADGLVRGDNPRTIARRMIEQGIGTKTRGVQSRALTIARTETIRAHAEGQLDALEQMGVDKIGVMVEWSAAGDDRTCPKCLDLDGIVMKLKEARGIIPRHPNCRCSYIPANVGEATKGQIRGKADIQEAIDKSISRDLPKRTKRTLAEQKRRSSWAGADLKPGKVRPRDIATGGDNLRGAQLTKAEPTSIFKTKETERVFYASSRELTATVRSLSDVQLRGVLRELESMHLAAVKEGRRAIGKEPKWIVGLKKEVAQRKVITPSAIVPRKPRVVKLKPTPTNYTRAKTIQEAEEQSSTRLGIQARFSHPNASIDFFDDVADNVKWSMDTEDVNDVLETLGQLKSKYPDVRVDKVGTFYHDDLTFWRRNFEIHIEQDRLGYKGKRWRRVDAEKRVRKTMVSEPTPKLDFYDQEYSIFRGGEWVQQKNMVDEYAIRVNHKKVLIDSTAKSEAERVKDLAKGRSLSNVDSDYRGMVTHEFGHAFHDQYGLVVKDRIGARVSYNKRIQKLFDELGEEKITEGLSSYAATNPAEMMAESFAEMQRVDPRSLARQIYKIMQEEAGL